ncbi:hypothetical protein ACNI3K_08885 [Demequina sp. SO4-13]|uniref:hypothetical protein n=1 Tax=Demequina sp. SO4-13 TaxID=3401027 RepID=UPI003AF8475E
MTTAPASSRRPPNDVEHVRLFLESVAEYRELAEAFPLPATEETIPAPAHDHARKWARVVRAASLRKFVLGEGDNVYLPRVVGAAHRLAKSHIVLPRQDQMRDSLSTGLAMRYYGLERSPDDVLDDFLNGTLLHTDYGRRARQTGVKGFEIESSLHEWTSAAEQVLTTIHRMVAQAVVEGRLAGMHPDEAPSRELWPPPPG